MSQKQAKSRGCQEALENLRDLWLKGCLREVSKGSDQTLAEHLSICPSCRLEAESLAVVDERMQVGFAELERSTGLPDSDQIGRMLREVIDDPTVSLLRRTRRSVRMLLWFAFFFLSLLGGSALVALAYKALFQR